ncbi:MAG: dockerin type I domain-containing protein, partial [Candidatus Stygibacter frigidus]|nr:dockerin type I domain-containing protein [Candidatus Stygibacter frigidus]
MRTKLLLFLILIPIVLHCQVIDEGFESGDFSAYNWVLSGDAEWFVSGSYPFEGDYCAQGGNVADDQDTAIEIELEFPQDGILAFAWKVSSEANYDFLQFYLDDELFSQISGTVAWTQVGYELEAGVHSLRWNYHKDYSVSAGSDIGWIDDVFFFIQEDQYAYDMELVSMIGDNYLTGGEEYLYEVTVRNNGEFNATGYTVSLVDADDNEYASETIYWMLPPGDERFVELTIAPEENVTDTLIGLYGKVTISTDDNPANNYSIEHDIHITGSQNHFSRIGDSENLTSQLPVNLVRNTSICQMLYYADEMGATGVVSSIDIFNNFVSDVSDIGISIWLGETEQNSLLDGWISADSLQLVYDESYNFPGGENILNIQLDSLFDYQGTNLVMMIEKEYEEDLNSWQSNFYYSEVPGIEVGRTRFSYSDHYSFDPCNMIDGILCDWVVNTVFTISPISYGDISDNGVVDSYDASLVLMYVVGLDPLPELDPLPWSDWRVERADVNLSGDIGAIDAAYILQYVVGIISE